MKKRYLLFAGAILLVFAFAGCGKKKDVQPEITPTPTPVVTETPTPTPQETLVEMEKTEKNAIGNKSATASKVTIINETDAEISAIYIRPYDSEMDDSEWGNELIKGSFTIKDGENANYYFDKTAKDESGMPITQYDIRIVYTNSDRSENYFRKLPLTEITKIKLCMDSSDWGNIPYAAYEKVGSSTEYSTLEEVKERLGYYDYEEESTNSTEEEVIPEGTTNETENGSESEIDSVINAAEGCIGSSLDTLISTIGEPLGSDYEDEPESGETGYHYYDSFTVYTTVDENGNEIVAGVW